MRTAVRSYGALKPEQLQEERRGEPRQACAEVIDILPCVPSRSAWHFESVELVDCSPSGIGIISDSPMKVGDEFLVKLEDEAISLLLYSVRHCTLTDRRRYHIGAQFTSVAASPLFVQGRESVLEKLLRQLPGSAVRPARMPFPD
jgi:hypothetical protein